MEKYSKTNAWAVQLPICDRTVVTELSGDFTLPDYQPEIKRLLRVGASVLPPSKYIGDRDAEFAGNIDYFVLYTGSDNELYCAPLTAEYKINVPMENSDSESGDGIAANPIGEIVTAPDMISGRVTAPRKINIKCRLKSVARVLGEIPVEDSFGDGDDSIQVLDGTVQSIRLSHGVADMIRVSDEMIYDSKEGDVRVVSADGRVMMNEIVTTEGAVSCRGEVYVKLLLCRDGEGRPYTTVRKIPFSGSLRADDADTGCSARVDGTVSEMNVTVGDSRIGIDVGVIIESQICRNVAVKYLKDVYSTEIETENSYKELSVPVSATMMSGNFTLSDSVSLEEAGVSQGMHVIDVSGSASVEEMDFDGENCSLSGKAKFSVLAEKEDEYSVFDVELPFNYRARANGGADRAVCRADVINARARMDGERLGIDAEIYVYGNAMAYKKSVMLAGVGFGEEISRDKGEVVICYPDKEDTLWSVAKRYGATVGHLSITNGISQSDSPDAADSLNEHRYLII